jgi:two-component system response regulator HydG
MPLRSLKSKLLAGVSLLVISSGVIISILVTHRYSENLFESLAAQAQYLTHAVSLQAADMVLTNDRLALQKMLEHQLRSNPSLSYLFVLKDGQVLAHTFPAGLPVDLITANEPNAREPALHLQEIASETGEYFLDMALPIFDGKAGTLRLGFSEKPYREQVRRLWVQMALFTVAVLALAVTGCLLFVRRITGPLTRLAEAVDRVDRGEMDVRVQVHGEDEVAALAGSFNSMLANLKGYTERLKEQAQELERAHQQTRTLCGLVQDIGALQTLREVGGYLIERSKPILECSGLAFALISDARDTLFVVTDNQTLDTREPEPLEAFCRLLEKLQGQPSSTGTGQSGSVEPSLAELIRFSSLHATIPILHQDRSFGALFIACSGDCRCDTDELLLVSSMLNQASGTIRRAMLHEEEIMTLQNRVQDPIEFSGIVSKNPKMHSIFRLIEDIAPTDTTVLIQGESGTGKELVARAIHRKSPRNERPFVVIDCSAYPATLLESELFGHEKGAFTGAIRQKSGRFEQADGGTVFLDEIGEVPLSAQIKLLRVIQTHQFERIGGEQTLSVNVRIIAATNRSLIEAVKEGLFREDLYYRLNVIPIHLPPLRDRRNDIPVLARHFITRFATLQGKRIGGIGPDAMKLLLDYDWPGNVRELENTIEHATVLAKEGRVEAAHLPTSLQTFVPSVEPSTSPTMSEHATKLLRDTMEECGWNKKEAARRLGISRSTLYEKLKRHRITRPLSH